MQVFGFWVWALWGSENLTKTLKLAKVGLAKVGQAHDWPKSVKKLAKIGLAKVGQHSETLKLAKVGLAKVGHDQHVVQHAMSHVTCRIMDTTDPVMARKSRIKPKQI